MRILRLLVSVFFLVTIWALFLFGRFFMVEKPIENLKHIPENSIFAMRLDGSSALKSTLFSILLEANDPEVIQVINEQINKKWKRKGVSKSLGIDYLSDIVVYVFPFEGERMLGITYNLNYPDRMRKNASLALDSNQWYAINEDIGVVLTFLGKNKLNLAQKAKAIQLAKKIAFEPIKSDLADKIASKETNKFVQMVSQGMLYGSSTLFTRMDMDLSLEEHSLVLGGQLLKNPREKALFNNKNYTLQPSGLHFYTTLVPEGVQDSLRKLKREIKLNIPDIQAIAINYRGLKINNPNGTLVNSPDIDLILNFTKPVQFADALQKSELLDLLKWKFLDQKTLTNGLDRYYLTQLDSKTVVISSNKNVRTIKNDPSSILSMEGELTYLTEVSGDKWILLFLNNFPFYFNSKAFFEKTEGVKLTIRKTKLNNAIVQGRFDFKKQYSPMNEFFKYAVQNNFIRLK